MSVRPPAGRRPLLSLTVAVALTLGLAGCTGGDDLADAPTPDDSTDLTDLADLTADGGGDDGGAVGDEAVGDGIGDGPDDVGEPDLVVTIDEEAGEDAAEPPALDDDDRHLEPGDPDHVADPGEPSPLDQGSALLCAVIEMGRDAIVDGDSDRVASLSQTLADDLPPIEDDRLRTIADGLAVDAGLDPSDLDEGLVRCESLGYEASI